MIAAIVAEARKAFEIADRQWFRAVQAVSAACGRVLLKQELGYARIQRIGEMELRRAARRQAAELTLKRALAAAAAVERLEVVPVALRAPAPVVASIGHLFRAGEDSAACAHCGEGADSHLEWALRQNLRGAR